MTRPMKDHLSRNEIRKDAVQGAVEAAATAVGEVATILTTAVRDVAGALGGLATEVFELRDAARKAAAESDGLGDEHPLELVEDPEIGEGTP
ncbi:hypothetical protein [Nocardioides sp.]|jgi:hypothetical protein|uniref:hypothetical protein n=1 Tax=Nocardioides sp. TaxID=35761 RepID=UPI0031FF0552|nr:hypothetical protein [Nocardioides sp.]